MLWVSLLRLRLILSPFNSLIQLQRFEEIDGLPKQTVIGAWKVKFDQICRGGEGPCPIANRLSSPQLELTNPTKEQLYDLFMRILSIKKYEHQILYNACQVSRWKNLIHLNKK